MNGLLVSAEELIALRHQARNLNLTSRRPVSSVLAGVHTSRFRGRGVDFVESRHYQPGDDFRDIDWRVTARTGQPHTKVFQEERERPVIVLLDLSAGMFFGSRVQLKSVQAAKVAALVAWAAVYRGDRIGGLICADQEHREIRPTGGRRGAMRLLRQIELGFQDFTPDRFGPVTDLQGSLERLRRIARPGSLVVLISDLRGMSAECERHLARLKLHTDVVAVEVVDPLELHAPPPAVYAISDGRRAATVDLSGREQQRYLDELAQHRQQLRSVFSRYNILQLRCQTDQSAFNVLSRAFGAKR